MPLENKKKKSTSIQKFSFDKLASWPHLAVFVTFTTGLLLLSILCFYSPVLIGIFAVVLFPLYMVFTAHPLKFEKLKTLTLVFGRSIFILTVLQIVPAPIFSFITIWMLRINVFEATFEDFLKKHYFNAFSGAMLLLTSALITAPWVDGHPYYFLVTSHPLSLILWIIAYTIWNWNFVINNFSSEIGYLHIGILGTPLLFCLISATPGLWLLFRSASLLMGVGVQIKERKFIEKKLKSPRLETFIQFLKSRKAQIGLAGLVLVMNLLMFSV